MAGILLAPWDGVELPVVNPLQERELLLEEVAVYQPSIIIFNANYHTNDPFETYRLNIMAFTNIVYVMKKLGIERLILISTKTPGPAAELYALSKARVELLAVIYCQCLVIIRSTTSQSVDIPTLQSAITMISELAHGQHIIGLRKAAI